jgi:RHS repeat-associated protein
MNSSIEVSMKRYRFCGKERDEETGLYYFGARFYAPWICRFTATDPLQEKYPFLNPYSYCLNNPIKLIDVDGREVYITGDAAKEAFNKLQEGTNIKLEMGTNGRISVAHEGNDPSTWNESDGKLFAAVMSDEVTVNLTADNSNVIERDANGNTLVSETGGSFMGNTLSFDGNKATSASTQQFVSMDKLTENYSSNNIGSVINHEITESYMGGLISMEKGKAASPAFSESKNKIYNKAHKMASPCPTMKDRYIVTPAAQKLFKELGTAIHRMKLSF